MAEAGQLNSRTRPIADFRPDRWDGQDRATGEDNDKPNKRRLFSVQASATISSLMPFNSAAARATQIKFAGSLYRRRFLAFLGPRYGASVSRCSLSSGRSGSAERKSPPRFPSVTQPVMPISNPMSTNARASSADSVKQ